VGEQASPHDRARRPANVLLVAVGLVLLGVIAWSAARSDVDGGARTDAGTPLDEGIGNDLGLVLAGAAGTVVVLAILPFLFRRRDRLRGERDTDSPVNWRRVVATVMLGLALVYAMLLLARRHEDETEEPPPAPPPEATDAPETEGSEGATGWTAVALLASGAVVVLVVAAVVHHRRRGRRFAVGERVAVAVSAPPTVLELDALDPAEAVRAAYAGGLHLLASIGIEREVAETPREHLARVRTAEPDATEPLSILIARYELVRYSHHAITPEMKDDVVRAYSALTTMVDDRLHEALAT
jgi:hypothetical protein